MTSLLKPVHIAIAALSLSLMGASIAKADTILDYTFSPGSFYNFIGGASYSVSGSFSYDVDTGILSNVDYTRGSDHFTTAALYSGPSEIYFGPFGTADYDVYQLTNSLALGGTDVIFSGTHPAIPIDAGGSLVEGVAASATPEPATWAIMLLGIGGIGATLRRSKRQQSATVAAA